MFDIQSKISGYAKKEEIWPLKKRNKSIENSLQLIGMLELDKDQKYIIIAVCLLFNKISRHMEDNFLSKTKIKLVELKTTIQLKIPWMWLIADYTQQISVLDK